MHIILLQAQQGAAGWLNIVFLVGIMVVFYFFIILPQNKKQKKERAFREGLKKGDKVVTISGVYGRIQELEKDTVLLEVDNNTKIRIERAALRDYQPNQQG